MKQIPKHLHPLFWDVNIATFDPCEHPKYTISRVLELGDKEAITWMQGIFSESQIDDILKADEKLSPKSANFWAIIYGIPLNQVAALKRT